MAYVLAYAIFIVPKRSSYSAMHARVSIGKNWACIVVYWVINA